MGKRHLFTKICRNLSLPDPKLLQWSEEDRSAHPEATKLGASLQYALDLYTDLQTMFISEELVLPKGIHEIL